MEQAFYKKLIDNNKQWVKDKLAINENYFTDLAKGQQPPVLWIGCADSRVPANEVIGAKPGEVFVHRNIANMVIHTDMNMLSVLDFAVNVLKVKHIIVCGHYGCGGIKAAMGNQYFGIIDNWIRHIKDVYRLHHQELNELTDENSRFDRFVELNVVEQVYDLAKTSILQRVWKKGQTVHIHGWVYNIRDGHVIDLGVNFSNEDDLDDVYKLIIERK